MFCSYKKFSVLSFSFCDNFINEYFQRIFKLIVRKNWLVVIFIKSKCFHLHHLNGLRILIKFEGSLFEWIKIRCNYTTNFFIQNLPPLASPKSGCSERSHHRRQHHDQYGKGLLCRLLSISMRHSRTRRRNFLSQFDWWKQNLFRWHRLGRR